MELDFMRFLCAEESRLWIASEAEEAVRYRRIERRFLAEHLEAWVPEYCQKLLAEPRAPFFHGVARVLSGFLAEDAALLESWSGEEDRPGHPDPASIRSG
jgi:TorA maturation chaperone TorD